MRFATIMATLAAAAALLALATAASAEPPAGPPDPIWAADGLHELRPRTLSELSGVEKPGIPAFDESCGCWFASANGSLARVIPGGGLEVVADDVQGIDVDVHSAAGVAVSREPDDSIVLHRFGEGKTEQIELAAGPGFFHPRFSPDGSVVLVSESRAGGGHMWLLSEGAAPLDLGQGYGPCWHPDGKRVFFSRIEHDTYRVSAADLWSLELKTGRVARVTDTPDSAETEPAFSLDGKQLAYVDAVTGRVRVVPAPDGPIREGR